MNWLRIMLNSRKHFVIPAAMAAALVLLAGGANATTPPTVRCIPLTNPNPACTAHYGNIQAAVNAASSFDIIFVGPGTYHESVTIKSPGGIRDGISLFGAQAGNDAREGRDDSTKESIVDATGKAGPAFLVTANYVVIDGFTVQGGTAASNPEGIFIKAPSGTPCGEGAGLCGPQVLNNIIQNNGVGVLLDGAPPPLIQGATIERNLFSNNNAENLLGYGFGIASIIAEGLVITENEFTENKAAAMVVVDNQGATITENTSENDGAFVVFVATTSSQFSHNRGKNFGHAGVLTLGFVIDPPPPTIYADAAIDIGPGNSALEISYNELENGKAPISNGIDFTNAFGPGSSYLLNVINNKIKQFPDHGIVAKDLPTAGTLYDSSIIGNEVFDNGTDGIFIEGTLAFNYGNDLFDNIAEDNTNYDCKDGTNGGFGTLGTSNFWFNNLGSLSSPTGLCAPVTLHEHD
jgi:hypothetical protein